MSHDKEFSNSIRNFGLDANICSVLFILNHGVNWVFITLICSSYLKNEDLSMGYFPHVLSPVGSRHCLTLLRPGVSVSGHLFSSISDCKIFEGKGCGLENLLGAPRSADCSRCRDSGGQLSLHGNQVWQLPRAGVCSSLRASLGHRSQANLRMTCWQLHTSSACSLEFPG